MLRQRASQNNRGAVRTPQRAPVVYRLILTSAFCLLPFALRVPRSELRVRLPALAVAAGEAFEAAFGGDELRLVAGGWGGRDGFEMYNSIDLIAYRIPCSGEVYRMKNFIHLKSGEERQLFPKWK